MNEIEIHDEEPGALAPPDKVQEFLDNFANEKMFGTSCPFGHQNCRCSRPAYCGR